MGDDLAFSLKGLKMVLCCRNPEIEQEELVLNLLQEGLGLGMMARSVFLMLGVMRTKGSMLMVPASPLGRTGGGQMCRGCRN